MSYVNWLAVKRTEGQAGRYAAKYMKEKEKRVLLPRFGVGLGQTFALVRYVCSSVESRFGCS